MAIRRPIASDEEAIAQVHVDAWRETYSHLLSDRFFDDATLERLRAMWRRLLADENPRHSIRVAEHAGRIVGFAGAWESAVDSDRDGGSDGDHGELILGMLYLLAGHHGSGLGQRMLDAVVGERPATLWMARDNPRALAFYRRNGFAPTGQTRLDESFDNLPEIRLAR